MDGCWGQGEGWDSMGKVCCFARAWDNVEGILRKRIIGTVRAQPGVAKVGIVVYVVLVTFMVGILAITTGQGVVMEPARDLVSASAVTRTSSSILTAECKRWQRDLGGVHVVSTSGGTLEAGFHRGADFETRCSATAEAVIFTWRTVQQAGRPGR